MKFLINICLRSEFSAQIYRNWIKFFFTKSDVQYNITQVSPYDPTKLAIHSILRPEDDLISNCGQNFKKTVSFKNSVHFTDEEDIVIYEDFDCSIPFYPEVLQKSERSTENGITFPDPVKNPSAITVTIGITILLLSSITLISFWTRTIYGTWFQQLLCHSITPLIDTLCPISTLNQQLTNLEQTHIRCSLPCEQMDSQRKGLRVSFAFFQRNLLPDGRVNETVATVEELSDLWKPVTMDGIPPFVMNCNCI